MECDFICDRLLFGLDLTHSSHVDCQSHLSTKTAVLYVRGQSVPIAADIPILSSNLPASCSTDLAGSYAYLSHIWPVQIQLSDAPPCIKTAVDVQRVWLPERQQVPLLLTAFVQQLIFLPVIGLVQLVKIVDRLHVRNTLRRTSDVPGLPDSLHDCFILAMGSAIGASVLYRRPETRRFYEKAREFFDLQPRYGLERLQEMILLAMFKLLEPEVASDLDLCTLRHTTVTYILALGLHKEAVCKSLASPDSCRRIFWSAYALDRKVSLANKLTLSLKDEDITAEYFSDDSEPPLFQMLPDDSGVTDEQLGRIPFNCKSWNLSLSRQLIKLTRITSATLSVASSGSLADRLARARALHSRLDRWRLAIKQHHDSSALLDPITCLPRGPMLERIRTHCELEYHEHSLHIYEPLIGELLYAVPTLICLTSASAIIRLIGQLRQRLIPLSIPISRLVSYAATIMIQSYSECEKSGQESLSIYTIHSIMSDTGCAIRSLEMFKDDFSNVAISRLSAARDSLQWVADNQTINENINQPYLTDPQGTDLTELDVNPFAILDVDFFPGWTMLQ